MEEGVTVVGGLLVVVDGTATVVLEDVVLAAGEHATAVMVSAATAVSRRMRRG